MRKVFDGITTLQIFRSFAIINRKTSENRPLYGLIYRNRSISSHGILFTFTIKIGYSGTNLLYPIFFKMSSRCV